MTISASIVRVYPRVGGETSVRRSARGPAGGLSPRGRGNRGDRPPAPPPYRSIPAWAGKPPILRTAGAASAVYPRVGGETSGPDIAAPHQGGLSPRGRGNRGAPPGDRRLSGSIPAWAGKPKTCSSPRSTIRVYPRVGGETRRRFRPKFRPKGLSPRGRGNLERQRYDRLPLRSIPAWAGKPTMVACTPSRSGVYPRVGGETTVEEHPDSIRVGLSPRGRGNLDQSVQDKDALGSIPAWAGKPVKSPTLLRLCRVYPRVGGETLHPTGDSESTTGLSPRGRGNRPRHQIGRGRSRSIPAWAGKPAATCSGGRTRRVYPRVGGETPLIFQERTPAEGLSPRGRGNPPAHGWVTTWRGSIPAWAGKPRRDPQRLDL